MEYAIMFSFASYWLNIIWVDIYHLRTRRKGQEASYLSSILFTYLVNSCLFVQFMALYLTGSSSHREYYLFRLSCVPLKYNLRISSKLFELLHPRRKRKHYSDKSNCPCLARERSGVERWLVKCNRASWVAKSLCHVCTWAWRLI